MNKNRKLINALLVSTMMLSGLASTASAADGASVERIGGNTRVETAVNVSTHAYDKADTVVLAGYNGQVDALTGTALASSMDVPLLLVSEQADHVAAVGKEILRLEAKNVVLLGSTNVISKQIEDGLTSTGLNVSRVAGDDRFDTAVAVAKKVDSKTGHAFLAYDGRNGVLADALAAGPASGMKNSPILLTSTDKLPAQTKAALTDLNISEVTIVGGTSAVSNGIVEELKAMDIAVERVFGDNRWETAEAVAEKYFAEADKAIIANDGYTGSYADALVGGYFGAKHKMPVLLTQVGGLTEPTKNFLGSKAMYAYVLGSEGVVSKAALEETKAIVDKNIAENVLSIESVSPINAKTLKVTFNTAVDTSKATIAVKKGSITSNVSKTTWNDAKTEVTLELAGKLTAGEYTVSVTGLTDKALTSSVTVENERVEEVKILSDKAVLNAGKTAVTVGYQVVNQYGEDITSSYAVNSNAAGATVNTSGTVTATRGEVTVPVLSASVKEGDTVVLTLVHVASGKSASQALTVSAASTVSDIKITGVYNKDGKTLNETTNLTRDAFYLVVEGKDQYGKEVSASALDALLKNNTNSNIVGLGSSFETIKINGEDATVLRLTGNPTAGITNVMLISATTGKNASYTVEVAEAQRADAITFNVPELVVDGETLFVPVTVLDKEGNEITDIDVLNDTTRGIKVNGATNVLTKNSKGQIGYSIASGSVTEGYLSLVGLSATNKSAVQNIKVEAAAKPTVVRGLASNVSAVLLANKTLAKADLVVEDQYGRAMTASAGTALTLAANSSATSGYRVVVKDNASNTVIANGGTQQEIYDGDTITLNKGTNGAEKVEFSIEEYKNGAWTAVAGSSQDIEFRVTDGTEYASYEVEEIGTIFDELGAGKTNNSDYDKDLVVYGVLDDGKKVELQPSDYTVTAPTYLGYSSGKFDVNDTSATPNVDDVPYAKDATEVKANVIVTINATGKQFTQEVTVSKVAPKVVEFKIVAEGTSVPADKAAYDKLTELTTVPATGTAFFTSTAANTVLDFMAIDSYGVISKVDAGTAGTLAEFKLVGTPAVAHTVTFTNQNASTLAIAGLEKDEVVTVTATVDGLSKSFKISGIVDSLTDVATAASATTVLISAGDDATLPATHAGTGTGTTITWTKAGAPVLGTTSVASGDTLVATFTKGSATTTRTYTVAGVAGSLTAN